MDCRFILKWENRKYNWKIIIISNEMGKRQMDRDRDRGRERTRENEYRFLYRRTNFFCLLYIKCSLLNAKNYYHCILPLFTCILSFFYYNNNNNNSAEVYCCMDFIHGMFNITLLWNIWKMFSNFVKYIIIKQYEEWNQLRFI